MNPSCTRMVTGASDNQLRVWSLDGEAGHGGQHGGSNVELDAEASTGTKQSVEDSIIAVYMGSMTRQGNGVSRITGSSFSFLLTICGEGFVLNSFALITLSCVSAVVM